ncbi:MAG: DUF58 domain-containing protein [Actinomycetota bacterium]|nr:DUF58 domain-containing protein [Actinomycetota bacterium]
MAAPPVSRQDPAGRLASARAARRLRLEVGRRLDGLLHGEHLGITPGGGLEAAEARIYVPGDDVRRIDWTLLARTGVPHLRERAPEREIETTLLIDLSASMSFGTVRQEKRELAVAVSAGFLHIVEAAGDRAGAVVVGASVRRIPPARGRSAATALLHRVMSEPRVLGEGATLVDGLHAVANPPRRRGLVVVVTDLADEGWARPLRSLALRHEVVVVEVVDPRELELPDVGLLRLVDPETGREVEVPTGRRSLRVEFATRAAQLRARNAAMVRRAGAGHLVVRTDRDWVTDLARFLATRRRTRTAGRTPAARP